MMRRRHQCDTVRALNGLYLAQELAIVFVNHHEPVLARNKDAMIGGIGSDIVPAPIAAQCVGMRDSILISGLPLRILHRKDNETE